MGMGREAGSLNATGPVWGRELCFNRDEPAEVTMIKAPGGAFSERCGRDAAHAPPAVHHTCRAIIIFLTSAIALAGLSPFGQVLAQFMIVWQR
jgi:hypothetical protein